MSQTEMGQSLCFHPWSLCFPGLKQFYAMVPTLEIISLSQYSTLPVLRLSLQSVQNYINLRLFPNDGLLRELLLGLTNAEDFGKTANAFLIPLCVWSSSLLSLFCLEDIRQVLSVWLFGYYNIKLFNIHQCFLFALRAKQGKIDKFCIFTDFVSRFILAHRANYPL